MLVGGPSLHIWEQYKGPIAHDHWWANFVHAARVRTEQLRVQLGPNAMITWLVYKPGYIDRGRQEKQDLISNINSVRDKFHLNLVYFDHGSDVINYLNNGQPRDQLKISGLRILRTLEQGVLPLRLQQRHRQRFQKRGCTKAS